MNGLFLAIYVVFLLSASLFPMTGFRWPESDAVWRFLTRGVLSPTDAVANFVVYVPYGWLLANNLSRRRTALVVASLTSLAVELAQLFIPGRVPSPWDLLLNTAGAALGILLARRLSIAAPWFRQDTRARWGLLVLTLWVAVELYPFVPVTDVDYLRTSLRPLVEGLSGAIAIEWPHVALRTLVSFVVGIAWIASVRPKYSSSAWLFTAFTVVLAAKIPIIRRELTLEAVLGTVAGLVVLALVRRLLR